MTVFSILLFFAGLVMSSVLPATPVNTFVECALVCSGIVLMVHLADRVYFRRQNRMSEMSQEKIDYMSRHLVSHLKSAGISDEGLSKQIVDIALSHSNRKPDIR